MKKSELREQIIIKNSEILTLRAEIQILEGLVEAKDRKNQELKEQNAELEQLIHNLQKENYRFAHYFQGIANVEELSGLLQAEEDALIDPYRSK